MLASGTGRKRSRLACQTCRDLKRRCDGAHPCGTCVRFEYNCVYQDAKAKRGRKQRNSESYGSLGHDPASAKPKDMTPRTRPSELMVHSPESISSSALKTTPKNQARSLEANSGSAFVRRLALRMDPTKRNPRMHTFAWNAFLGSRQSKHIPVARPLTELMSLKQMQDLAAIYFRRVHSTYGFSDPDEITQLIQQRWTDTAASQHSPSHDAILFGIAALGCLFSQVQSDAIELNSVESARLILEQSISIPPSRISINAWLLRVVYLRVAGTHYEAWTASNLLMHMVEAAGLTLEASDESALPSTRQDIDVETARRLVAIAQHLNIWMSFDMGLTRVALANKATTTIPSSGHGDFTNEISELLPFTIELDPERRPTASELEIALHTVLDRAHSSPPTILAQCNLALCLCRRLRSMDVALTDTILQKVLMLTTEAISAARTIFAARAPWHHMAYVPFQIICVLLAIDTVSSISQLRDAMQCLKDISMVYNTPAIQEALKTARSLVLLHQKGKEMFASALDDILKVCPSNAVEDTAAAPPTVTEGMEWVDDFSPDFSSLQFFDIEQFLNPGFFWNAGSNVMI